MNTMISYYNFLQKPNEKGLTKTALAKEHMTPAEIVADTRAGVAELLEVMKKRKLMKV